MNIEDSRALEDLKKWEIECIDKHENGIVSKAFKRVGEIAKPIAGPIFDTLKPFTDSDLVKKVQDTLQVAISGAFQFTHDNIKYTYDKKYILKSLKIDSFDQLSDFNANTIELHVKKVADQNRIASAIEGAGFGMGGIESTLAEIPVFFSLLARVQQQICSCYGFNPESEFEQAFMLKAMAFSDIVSVGGKAELLLEMNALKIAIKRHTYQQLSEMGNKFLIPQIAKNFAATQGVRLSKTKMIQGIPVIGAVIGGLFNYGYISRVINTTNRLYKKRFLESKFNIIDMSSA